MCVRISSQLCSVRADVLQRAEQLLALHQAKDEIQPWQPAQPRIPADTVKTWLARLAKLDLTGPCTPGNMSRLHTAVSFLGQVASEHRALAGAEAAE